MAFQDATGSGTGANVAAESGGNLATMLAGMRAGTFTDADARALLLCIMIELKLMNDILVHGLGVQKYYPDLDRLRSEATQGVG